MTLSCKHQILLNISIFAAATNCLSNADSSGESSSLTPSKNPFLLKTSKELELPVFQKCCNPGSFLVVKGTDNYACRNLSPNATATGLTTYDWSPVFHKTNATPDTVLSKRLTDFKLHVYFPRCEKCVIDHEYRVLEDGQVIISGATIQSKNPTDVWLSLNNASFCIDEFEESGLHKEVVLVCHESLGDELKNIELLLKTFIHDTIASGARTTGWVSIVSAIFLAFAIAIYILLWREHNIHGWTQFSFLLALFCTYFIAGLRRLIGFEELYAYNLASTFEALEDFGAVSTSANLVALSFDLFYTLWRSLPTYSKGDGLKRFLITTTLAWSTGAVVMTAGLILKSGQSYEFDVTDMDNLTKYLRKLLEFFLCIQNDMFFAICVPIVQLSLFFLNLVLFMASVIVLHRKQRSTELAFENFATSYIKKFWIRRFSKLFLIMGLWWPLSVICVFECVSMFQYTAHVWKNILSTFYLKHDHVSYVIPWHMYLISNCLAVQAIIIGFIFVWNRKTCLAFRKRYPQVYIPATS